MTGLLIAAARPVAALALVLCPHGTGHHHRQHVRPHARRPAVSSPAPDTHQVDTARIGTAIQVEKVTLTDGRTITVTHRPGVRLP